jgi:hypothetical protein
MGGARDSISILLRLQVNYTVSTQAGLQACLVQKVSNRKVCGESCSGRSGNLHGLQHFYAVNSISFSSGSIVFAGSMYFQHTSATTLSRAAR